MPFYAYVQHVKELTSALLILISNLAASFLDCVSSYSSISCGNSFEHGH